VEVGGEGKWEGGGGRRNGKSGRKAHGMEHARAAVGGGGRPKLRLLSSINGLGATAFDLLPTPHTHTHTHTRHVVR